MELVAVITLLIGLAVGALASWWVNSRLTSNEQALDRAGLETGLAEARGEAQRARAEVERAHGETERVRAELATVQLRGSRDENAIADAQLEAAEARRERSEIAAEAARLSAERDAALSRLESLTADSERMLKEFTTASSAVLDKQGRSIDSVAHERLKATEKALEPVTVLLREFQARLTEVEKERAGIAAEMRQQVLSVTQTGEALRQQTTALATALRKPQVRGAWGELQLKRAVEMAGMLDHCDFIEQATTVNATDATIRPDLKVLFGEGKFVYVDSKVPLSAFLDAQATEVEEERNRHLQGFARNVRSHIEQLSAKEYWKSDVGSPEFVVLFVPAEALFAEAMALMPDLHEFAIDRGVVLATPSSLIGMLRTVAYSWKQAALADSAADVLGLGRELHTRLATMGENFDKLGRAITSSVKAYNETVGSLESRVLPQARKFRDLSVTEKELREAKGLTEQPRPITAPELVDNAQQVEMLVGRERRANDQLELFRSSPSTEDLVESTHPRLLDEQRRRNAT